MRATILYGDIEMVVHFEPCKVILITKPCDLGENLISLFGPNELAQIGLLATIKAMQEAKAADRHNASVFDAYEQVERTCNINNLVVA